MPKETFGFIINKELTIKEREFVASMMEFTGLMVLHNTVDVASKLVAGVVQELNIQKNIKIIEQTTGKKFKG